MYVVTIDQRASSGDADRVPGLIGEISALTKETFERTVGDELQGVVARAPEVVDIALHALRSGRWYVGIGVGTATLSPSASPREGTGTAFFAARKAVELAKMASRVPLSVVSGGTKRQDPKPKRATTELVTCSDAEAVLRLLGRLVLERTPAQWAVVDKIRLERSRSNRHGSQKLVAKDLGITEQSVSRALVRSGWEDECAGRPAAAKLLEQAQADMSAVVAEDCSRALAPR